MKHLYLRISPDKFHHLKFILEGYDNLVILSSYDMKQGIVLLRYPTSLEKDIFGLLSSISSEIK